MEGKAMATQNPAHMCEMCEEMISACFDFCESCAYEVGFRTYPALETDWDACQCAAGIAPALAHAEWCIA